jgi:Cytochrome oxidase complex assembly protein 1
MTAGRITSKKWHARSSACIIAAPSSRYLLYKNQDCAMQEPPKRSWFSRNWLWVVPVGCLVPVLVCGGCGVTIAMIVFSSMKASEPYKDALTAARAHPAVKAELGEPIEAGFMVNGNIAIQNNTGTADISIPISGPKKSGTLHVVGNKADGKWTYSTMDVTTDGGAKKIDLKPAPGIKL